MPENEKNMALKQEMKENRLLLIRPTFKEMLRPSEYLPIGQQPVKTAIVQWLDMSFRENKQSILFL